MHFINESPWKVSTMWKPKNEIARSVTFAPFLFLCGNQATSLFSFLCHSAASKLVRIFSHQRVKFVEYLLFVACEANCRKGIDDGPIKTNASPPKSRQKIYPKRFSTIFSLFFRKAYSNSRSILVEALDKWKLFGSLNAKACAINRDRLWKLEWTRSPPASASAIRFSTLFHSKHHGYRHYTLCHWFSTFARLPRFKIVSPFCNPVHLGRGKTIKNS